MKAMQSFLFFFYILDQCYSQCKEDDLGGFLGAISPELLEDGQPIDIAIYNDWREITDPETISISNIVKKSYDFLIYYEEEYGFNFCETKQWLLSISNEVVEKAYECGRKEYSQHRH
ncbi:MAG: hypothetical protein NC307_07830 [Roseburia sp.]|nr:hypothetical protein [Roseburia sp.]